MEKHNYLEYQYKIDYYVLKEIWGATGPLLYGAGEQLAEFKHKVGIEHYVMLDEQKRMNNPDGCYYFNDVDELVFQGCREEDKIMMRTKIKENMVPRDTVP
ncbi:hypothetical protein FAX13_04605 [Ligilactobacillus animalis]|nr:hypothetical protein FAX13_04605 [Ligilactobacillus animalis]